MVQPRATFLLGSLLSLAFLSLLPGQGVGPQLARAADADRNGTVSAEEWSTFLKGLEPDKDGALNKDEMKARILLPSLDTNGDGAKVADLVALFNSCDSNKDGALQRPELPRGGFGGRGLAASIALWAADASGNGEITAEEWKTFKSSIGEGNDGLVPLAAMARWVTQAVKREADQASPNPALATMDANLDADNSGNVTVADLEALFLGMDTNQDKALQPSELTARRGRGRGAGRIRGTGDRSKPCLVPWQRNLEDALALVKRTGKPLLLCVNRQGESASETLAWRLYRDPDFAKLMSNFIPVVASVSRENPRDHDDRGRRIVDPRFGRVTSGESLVIEPLLYKKYFDGERVAPRHMAFDKDGKKLFDVKLARGMAPYEETLRKHGKATKLAAPQTEAQMLASPDAAHRQKLEQRFALGDERTRLRLASAASSATRATQHPEILRMALRDESMQVRKAAARAIATNVGQVPQDLLPRAFYAAGADLQLAKDLLSGLGLHAARAKDEATMKQLSYLLRVFSGQLQKTRLLDLAAWQRRFAAGEWIPEAPFGEDELSQLDEKLDALEKRRKADPQNAATDLELAATTLRYARVRILQKKDPSFLLEDARNAAKRASKSNDHKGQAMAWQAWASHLLGDSKRAVKEAAEALPLLEKYAGSPLTVKLLEIFARGRTSQLYEAMTAEKPWPDEWICDISAAYGALTRHPASTEQHAWEYLQFLDSTAAQATQRVELRRLLQRHAASNKLHEWMRAWYLAHEGAATLERSYASLQVPERLRPTVQWYAGLASLMAGDRHVLNGLRTSARGAYRRSAALFRSSVEANAGFAASANHYVMLACSAEARVQVDAGNLQEAVTAIQDAIAAKPDAANAKDGLGNTPAGNAGYVYRALLDEDMGEQAEALKKALAEQGVNVSERAPRRRGG